MCELKRYLAGSYSLEMTEKQAIDWNHGGISTDDMETIIVHVPMPNNGSKEVLLWNMELNEIEEMEDFEVILDPSYSN